MVIVVTGLPGSGKTFFASALSRHLKCIHLNTDMIRKSLSEAADYSAEGRNKIYEIMLERTGAILQNRNNVILDGTFLKQDQRDMIVRLVKQHNQEVRFIKMEASEDEIKKRVEKKRTYTDADFQVYKKLKNEHEPLQEDHLVLFSDRMNLEEMISVAEKYVKI